MSSQNKQEWHESVLDPALKRSPERQSKFETSSGQQLEVVYTPEEGFTGQDSFTYAITDDNGEYDTGSVSITVEEEPPELFTNPKKGYLHLRGREWFIANTLLNFIDCDAIVIGPVTFEVEINE